MPAEGPIGNKNESKTLLFEGDNWILPTDINLLEPAGQAFEKRLKEAGWDANEMPYLRLAFHEALVNAIIHGNLDIVKPEDGPETLGELVQKKRELYATNKKVYVTIEANENRVSLKIRDEGKGFNSNEVPDPTLSKGLLKTKGRGLLLMKGFFDSVTYNEKGNEVTLVKERGK